MKKLKKNTIEFIFNVRNKPIDNNTEYPVIIRFYRDRRKWIDRTLFYCYPNQWDEQSKRLTPKHRSYLIINTDLSYYESQFNLMLTNLNFTDNPLSDVDFIKFYEKAIEKKPVIKEINVIPSFNDFYKNELVTEAIKWRGSTIGDQKRTLTKINSFCENITSEYLDEVVKDFEIYLLSEGMAANSTLPKHMKNLRKYLTRYVILCKKNNLLEIDFDPFENYSIGRIKGNRVDLTPEEVEKIADLKLNEGSGLRITRDRFLFSCYTGLRISDNANLNTNFLQVSDTSGISIEMNRMIKVDYELNLELRYLFNGAPEKILLTYITLDEIREAHKLNKPQFVFPSISDQKINENLKVISRLAGLNKKLTFHVARHTCGTNLADTGADIDLIMEIMGIRKLDTARIYIHRSSERRRKKLSRLDWGIQKNDKQYETKAG